MKRDMDLIRRILLETEKLEPGDHVNAGRLPDIDAEAFNYNVMLMKEAGLVSAIVSDSIPTRRGGGRPAIVQRMTWAGHDFLDLARGDDAWRRAKEDQEQSGGGWNFEMWARVLAAIAMAASKYLAGSGEG